MRQILALIILVICLCAAGCARTFFPIYVVEMTVSRPGSTGPEIISELGHLATMESYREDTALVEDELVKINAALQRGYIWIGLISRTDQPLEIIWSEATVTHGGITEALIPYVTYNSRTESHLPTFGTKGRGDPGYADKPQPPMTIEPLGWVSVQTTPRSFCYFVYANRIPEGSWSTRHKAFFDVRLDAKQKNSERKAAMVRTVGQQVEVFIPLKTPDGRVDYTINLTVHTAEVGKYTHYIM